MHYKYDFLLRKEECRMQFLNANNNYFKNKNLKSNYDNIRGSEMYLKDKPFFSVLVALSNHLRAFDLHLSFHHSVV